MVPAASDPLPGEPPPGDDDDVSVRELVFSCCICQATVPDVYATVESNQGFHSGSSNEHGIVTKMWIASCSHVMCSKHLENGAVPFHPQDHQPCAACPKCIEDKHDDSPKDLFSIQGLEEGQYDPTIPDMWMHCPAIKLDDIIPGIDAVRFQYMALCHYGRQVRKHWTTALQEQSAANAALSKQRKTEKRLQSEQVELQNQVAALQKMEAHVKKWEDRKPVISHYMKAFPEMTKDNERMRSQLIELGFDVPPRKYLFEPADVTKSELPLSGPVGTHKENQHREASSGSASARPQSLSDNEHSSSARKRKRDQSFVQNDERHGIETERFRGKSRDLMPPPLPRAALTQQRFGPTAPPSSRQQVRPQHSAPFYRGSTARQGHSGEQAQQQRELNENYAYPAQQGQPRFEASAARQHSAPTFRRPPEPHSDANLSGYMHQARPQINHYDPVSIAQLSLQPSSQDEMLTGHEAYNRAGLDYRHASRSPPASRNLQHLANDRHSRQQEWQYREYEQPRPTGQFFASEHEMDLRAQHPMRVEEPVPRSQQTFSVAASPFFKRGADIIRPETLQRPPARGNVTSAQYPTNDGLHRIPIASIPLPRALFQSQNTNGSYHMNDYQPRYERHQMYSQSYDRPRQGTAIPQTPRNSQGFFQRPNRMAHSSHRSPIKAEPISHGRRITLPPSTSHPMPMPASQDEALSRIRGIRGASSHSNVRGCQPQAPNYNVARTLFSAGGRQSLRR